jgi:putative transposase
MRAAVRPLSATGRIVGIDRGVHVLAALSDGRLLPNRHAGERRQAATARLQRELESVTQRDGAWRVRNRRDPVRVAAVLRLARSREREANARRDHAHKLARAIVNGADVIALETLRMSTMTRSAKGTAQHPAATLRPRARSIAGCSMPALVYFGR